MDKSVIMRRVVVFLLLLLPLCGFAQKYKLIERNPKKKPSWMVDGTRHGYMMIQANKVPTLEEAQNSVMVSLLNQIASSISVQVVGEIEKGIDWSVVDLEGKTQNQYIEEIKNNITVKIARMPDFQGFSISKAEVYWERYRNKKTKEYCYDYYMLYPFSSIDLQELIEAYNAYEKAINDKIDNYRNVLDEIESVDVMLENINEMKSMMKEYEDDLSKYNRLKNNISLYEKTLGNIYIDVLENEKGKLVIQLKYDEKVMKTKSLPQLRSACARDFGKKHDGNKIVLEFNTFDCYEQDDNYVEVRFTFGKTKLVKKININL